MQVYHDGGGKSTIINRWQFEKYLVITVYNDGTRDEYTCWDSDDAKYFAEEQWEKKKAEIDEIRIYQTVDWW